MKPRDYCCCAIPLVNAGIYATILEQLVLGVVVGLVSLATPAIVGANTPSLAKSILAIVGFVVAGIQLLGFIGVAQEKPTLFARYVTLHLLTALVGFSVAIVWIILSVMGHSKAETRCETDFFGGSGSSEGQVLCNVFPWVDVGLMGALWIVLAIAQFYFFLVLSSYSSAQRRDHEKYDAVYDPTKVNPNPDTIPLTSQDGLEPWHARSPTEDVGRNGYGHNKQSSVGDVMNDPIQQTRDGFSDTYSQYSQASAAYPPSRQTSKASRQPSRGNTYVNQPMDAHTEEPSATPQFSDAYYTGGGAGMSRPPASQAHPGEPSSVVA